MWQPVILSVIAVVVLGCVWWVFDARQRERNSTW
jgi:cbb3-type cytochrome oxidase subunit 3